MDLVSTKPHVIRQRNLEYEAHQRNLKRVIGGRGAFSGQQEPIIRRKEKYVFFDKQQQRRLASCRAED